MFAIAFNLTIPELGTLVGVFIALQGGILWCLDKRFIPRSMYQKDQSIINEKLDEIKTTLTKSTEERDHVKVTLAKMEKGTETMQAQLHGFEVRFVQTSTSLTEQLKSLKEQLANK